MDTLTYQKKLAEFDEKASYHRMMMDKAEHEKAMFVVSVLDATMKDRAEKAATPEAKEVSENAG